MGLDRPFFEDKNRAFWILQSIGWTGYFFLRTISGFAGGLGWMLVVHTLLLTATGYSLTLLMGSPSASRRPWSRFSVTARAISRSAGSASRGGPGGCRSDCCTNRRS
jgi:hypothetical protein